MVRYDSRTGDSEAVPLLNDRFDALIGDFNRLEAELSQIKKNEKRIYKNILERENYKKLQGSIAMMYRTSQTQSIIFNQIHKICLELLKKARTSGYTPDEARIRQVIAKIQQTEKQGLAYAERLPFSIDEGWKPKGEISFFRKMFNLPGYLLVAPYFIGSGKRRTVYEKSLRDLQEVVDKAAGTVGAAPGKVAGFGRSSGFVDVVKAREDLEKAMKDFKVFIGLTTQLHRKFKRLHEECMKICKDLKGNYTVEQSYISSDVNVDREWAAL